jgi:Kef-type K+ transport system membrane component KefB
MPDLMNVLIVAAVAFLVPFTLGLVPGLRLPSVAIEITVGILIGPSVLGWVTVDEPLQVFALVGLAFLLLIAGLEVDFDRLRGRTLGLALLGFSCSFGLAVAAGYLLRAGGLVKSPLLIAIALSATGLGIVIPILKDAREIETRFGQLVVAAASVAEVGTIILLSLFFSGQSSSGLGAKLVLLIAFFAFVAAVGFFIVASQRSMRLSATLARLQDTTAQIRVRAAFVLLIGFTVAADRFGAEAILGAFLAGAIIRLVDRDQAMTHPQFRVKLEAAGFGVFIPFFFVVSGVRFDGHALFASGSVVARVPLFLAALLLVRGLPALVFRGVADRPHVVAAGLLQATSLSFLVVVAQLGKDLGLITPANGAALIAAGLLSVLLFPLAALTILRQSVAGPSPLRSRKIRLRPAGNR